MTQSAEPQGKRQRIEEMGNFLRGQFSELQVYDEQMVIRRLIEKVTVFEEKLTIEFKSCVEIDIEI